MIILKTLLSGGNIDQLRENESSKIHIGEFNDREEFATGVDNQKNKERMMEFMYCIPDLEVFIDKTIKKCLLEYDLDANDTEAVLDDMEKAWPKSPMRHTEKQVLKDSNDNSENGRNRAVAAVSITQEETMFDTKLDRDTLKGNNNALSSENLKDKGSPETHDKMVEPADVANNIKREIDHIILEGYRSDTSSPDVIDGQLQTRKHSKLKSLLQKRYFEGQESSTVNKVQPEQKSDEKVAEIWDVNKNMSSNLDLLASAADIHTVSARGTHEHRVQAIRRLQEESERQFHANVAKRLQEESERQFHANATKRLQEESERQCHANATKRLQNNSDEKSSTSGRMPVLLKLMTSSSPLSETRSHDKDTVSGHHNNSLRTLSPEISQRVSPVTSVHGNQHVKIISSQVEKNTSPFLNRDRAQQMVQPYQNGYRPTLPQETVVLRRDLSSSSDEGSLKFGKKHSVSVTRSIPSWSSDVDMSSCTAHSNHTGPTSRYQLNDHNVPQHYHNYSSNYIEPYRYHGSRIASIIAEELQKDDDCANKPPTRLSLVRAIPSENVSSNTHETTRSRSFSLPGTYKRATSKESAHCVSQILPIYNPREKYNITAGSKETVVNAYLSRTTSKILPAHLTISNTSSASGILAPHVGQTNTAVNNGVIRNGNTSQDDDLPQDLSTKSRRLMVNEVDGHHFSNSVAHVIESEFRDISRPVSHNDRSHHFESLSSCSQLPCESDFDSRCDTGSTPIKTSEMERKSQVYGLDINLEGVNDNHILVTKRNHREIACSETGDPGNHKRMKLQ